MDRKAAINFARVGAQKLWAGTVHIHPNAKTGAHHHGPLESVIYVVKGRARMRWGEALEFVAEAGPGRLHLRAALRAAPGDQRQPRPDAGMRAGAQRRRGGGRQPGHRAGRGARRACAGSTRRIRRAERRRPCRAHGAKVSVYLHPEAVRPYARMRRHPHPPSTPTPCPTTRRALATPTPMPTRCRTCRKSSAAEARRRADEPRADGARAQAAQAGRAPRADPADAGHDARAARRRAHHHRRAGGQAVGQRSGAVPPLRQQGADVRGPDRVHRIQRVHAGQPDRRARGRRRRAGAAHRSPCCCSSARRTRA